MYINNLFLLFFVSLCLVSNAQDKKIKRAIKYLNEGKYEKSKEEIDEYQNKNPESAIGFYAAYLWFSDIKNEGFNPDIAYNFLNRSIELERKLESALKLEYCTEYNFCKDSLDMLRENLGRLALDHLKEKSATLDQIEGFLLLYRELEVYWYALDYRDSKALMLAVAEKSTSAIENFIQKYPKSNYLEKAREYLYDAAYNEAKSINTEEALLKHNEKYKKSPYIEKCRTAAIELNYEDARKQQLEKAFLDHLKKYPESTFKNEALNAALEMNFAIAVEKNTEESFLKHIVDYPDSKFKDSCKNTAIRINFLDAKSSGTEMDYLLHIKKYPNSPYKNEAYNAAIDLNYGMAKNQNTEASYLQHVSDYPDSKYAENCMNAAADIAFASLNESSKIEELENFLKKYPNSKDITTVNSWLQKKVKLKKDKDFYDMLKNYESNIDSIRYLELNNPELFWRDKKQICEWSSCGQPADAYIIRFLSNYTLTELSDFCLSNNTLFRFFKNDSSLLIYGIKNTLLERLKRFNKTVYNYQIWGQLSDDLEIDQNGIKSSNGFTFYSESKSEFGLNLSGNVIIYYKGKQFLPEVFKSVEMQERVSFYVNWVEGLNYMFILKNQKGKTALFNTRKGKFVSDWVDNIEYYFLLTDDVDGEPLTANLIKLLFGPDIFLGYRLEEINDNNRLHQKHKAINTNGDEIISSKLFQLLNFSSISRECNTKVKFLTFRKPELNVRTSSGFLEGICNHTFDTIILEAKYKSIGKIDKYNNIDLVDENEYSKLYNFDKRAFLPIANDARQISRIYLPYDCYEQNQNIGITTWSCDKGIIYSAKISDYKGIAFYNYKGKQIYKSNDKYSKILCATDSIIIFSTDVNRNPHNIVIDIEGNLLWNPPSNYNMFFLTENHIIFYYDTHNGAGSRKYYGLYLIGKGIIQEPIYENVRIVKGACYGIKLGQETLIWSE